MDFTGERIVPGAANCEPTFAQKMYQEHVARYAFAAQFVEGRDVLDLACGVGYGSQWMAKAGAKSVLGVDIADDAIDHAKRNYFHPSVSYRVQDARSMDFDAKFDVVACFEFIEHIDEQSQILDSIKRSLRPDGTLIISTPRPLDDKRTHFHVHELEFEELRRLLVKRFSGVDCFFERNCFTSFLGANMPDQFERIVSVTDKIKLEDADYFVFVARLSEESKETDIASVLVVNDDSYVINLERDIVNLRNGENYHNQIITDISKKSENLGEELSKTKADLNATRQHAEDLSSVQAQLSSLMSEIALVREEVRVSAQMALLQAELEDLRRSHLEATVLNAQLSSDNERIRTVLAKVSEQLADTESRLNSKLAEADVVEQLRHDLAMTRESHAQSMNELAAKYEQSERTLNRFRRSVSWRVTRPIRWAGRQYKKAVGGGVA